MTAGPLISSPFKKRTLRRASCARWRIRYARQWGFRSGENLEKRSFWTAGTGRAGDVAVLVHPHSGITNVRPIRENYWTANLCLVEFTMDGH